MGYKVLTYQTYNLGDIVQTMALTRFLNPTIGILRDRRSNIPGFSVINGFISRPTHCGECLFAGVHLGTGYRRLIKWLASSSNVIGARDPYSYEIIKSHNLKSEMIGCATMTLPRYDGPREGVYSVNYDGPGIPLSHKIIRHMPLDQQWSQALEYLDLYRRAERVYTSRLHVALPCLAFGTPVYIDDANVFRPERFSLLYQAGIPMREVVQKDLTSYKEKYLKFLVDNGIKCVPEHDPVIPS